MRRDLGSWDQRFRPFLGIPALVERPAGRRCACIAAYVREIADDAVAVRRVGRRGRRGTHRGEVRSGRVVEVSTGYEEPTGTQVVRYLWRETEDATYFARIPSGPESKRLGPSKLRNLCVQLGIDQTDFGLPGDYPGVPGDTLD
jgi:hypothetical protein